MDFLLQQLDQCVQQRRRHLVGHLADGLRGGGSSAGPAHCSRIDSAGRWHASAWCPSGGRTTGWAAP